MTEWWEDLEVKTTRYDLGPIPILNGIITNQERFDKFPDMRERHNVVVEFRGRASGWAISDRFKCLGKSGEWAFLPFGEMSIEDGVKKLRWQDPQEAIAFYKSWLREFMETELAAQRRKGGKG